MARIFHRSPRTFLQRLWQHGRLDALACVGLIVVAELLARGAAPHLVGRLYDRETTGGYAIAINQDGYRGTAIAAEKPAGTFRILALGDSTTFGTGVAWTDTWPHALGEQLTAVVPAPVEVMNVGFPGTSLASLHAEFNERWAAQDPDHVIVALSANMPALAWIQARQGDAPAVKRKAYAPRDRGFGEQLRGQAKRWTAAFALPSLLRQGSQRVLFVAGLARHDVSPDAPFGPLLAHGWRQRDLPAQRAIEAWAALERDLVALSDTFEARETNWSLVYTPLRFMLSPASADNEKSVPLERLTLDPEVQIETLARKHRFPYVPVRESLLASRKAARASGAASDLYVGFDFTHLDARGHRAVATALQPYLLDSIEGDAH